MPRYSRQRTIFIIIAVVTGILFSQGVTAQLLQNPFKPPQLLQQSDTAKPNKNKPIRENWYPQLRATMRAGENSMANINGQILSIGEKIDGFELVEVYERDVFFIKQGLKYHVSMDQEQ